MHSPESPGEGIHENMEVIVAHVELLAQNPHSKLPITSTCAFTIPSSSEYWLSLQSFSDSKTSNQDQHGQITELEKEWITISLEKEEITFLFIWLVGLALCNDSNIKNKGIKQRQHDSSDKDACHQGRWPWVQYSAHTWRKERTDCQKLFSDLHMHVVACVPIY